MPSTTRVNGRLALRPCFIGARSTFEHAEALVADVLRIGAELEREAVRARHDDALKEEVLARAT